VPLNIPQPTSVVAEAVWANIVRTLTNLSDVRATRIDNLDALISSRLALGGLQSELDARTLTLVKMALLDAAISSRLSKADFDTKMPDARALRIDNLDVLLSSREAEADALTRYTNLMAAKTDIDNLTIPIPFPSAEAKDDVAVITATDTTERTITVALPTGASIVRVALAAFIVIINRSANAQDIDIDVKGRLGAGGWSTFFTQTDVISFPAVDKASGSVVALQDVSALVTAAGSYGFKLTVTLSSANTVRFITQYLLQVTYKMS